MDDISLNYNERIVKEEDDNIIGSQLSKDISRINQAEDSPIKNDESSYQFMVQSLQENQEKVGLDTMIMNESQQSPDYGSQAFTLKQVQEGKNDSSPQNQEDDIPRFTPTNFYTHAAYNAHG